MASGRTIPRVLLVISKDIKMFQQAYNELIDIDEDGRVDTGFNPSVLYYGYFDSKSCYAYTGSVNTHVSENRTNYFRRAGPTLEDEDQETLDAKKSAAGIASHVPAARAAHYKTGERIGICQAPHSLQGGNFSGNWLNYASATRMDVLRKILYGGSRQTDGAARTAGGVIVFGETILESSFVPRDSNVWGTDVLADDRWSNETPLTNYYDVSKYTPFPKPEAGKAHYFARTRSGMPESADNPPFPVLQHILNGDASMFGENIVPTGAGRYYDWVLNDGPNPSTSRLTPSGRDAIRSHNVRVAVCEPGNFGEGESCRKYPSGDFKPAGLLQKNGESGQMYFGLLTGSFSESTFRRGGVMRAHINDLGDSVDLETGVFKKGGLIHAIDTLRVAGSARHAEWNPSNAYSTGVSWGNPTGEMTLEAARYFQRLSQKASESKIGPTPSYVPSSETAYNYQTAPYLKNWTAVPNLPAGECAKPIILLIAEEDSDFDGDDQVNASNPGLERPVLSSYGPAAALGLPKRFQLGYYLDKITQNEGLRTAVSGRNYFYSASHADDCRPKPLTSLSQVKGLCPNNPAFEGTYSAAAVAYYVHTHNFSALETDKPVDVYAVTMSTSFPRLDIPVRDAQGNVAKRISILPASMSDRSHATTRNRILGFLNYYILEWQVDTRGTPYHIKIKVNFEDAAIGYDAQGGATSPPTGIRIS
jgi:type IV pilus assembly protein PilY1